VTRTEVRTVRTIDGQIMEDEYDPGTARTQIERFTYDGKTVNGDGPSTPSTGYAPGEGYRSGRKGSGSQSSVEDYRTPRRGPGSQSSVDDYRSPSGYGAQGGYSSADEGRRTPTTNGPSGYMSDSYATPTGIYLYKPTIFRGHVA
jgi:hypothetical protein